MNSYYSGEEMDRMKNSTPPPWFADYMRKSNQIAIRNLQTLQEILERVINLEERTKNMQKTTDQYKGYSEEK